MKKLIRAISKTTGLSQKQIKGNKRINRRVSYAKMLFCQLAYDHYGMMPREIAEHVNYSRENIYYLLSAGKNNLHSDFEYKELYMSILNHMYL